MLPQHEAKVSGVGVGNIQGGREKLRTIYSSQQFVLWRTVPVHFLAYFSSLEWEMYTWPYFIVLYVCLSALFNFWTVWQIFIKQDSNVTSLELTLTPYLSYSWLISWRRNLLEKPLFSQLVKKIFQRFAENNSTLLCAQELATCPHLESFYCTFSNAVSWSYPPI